MLAPLAYKYVAIAVMLAEVNYCASRLQLPIVPVKQKDIKAAFVFPPNEIGFAGRIDTTNYAFSFVKSGRLRYITKIEDGHYQSMGLYRGDQSLPEFQERLSWIKSVINTNDAYRIATNWLLGLDVDVRRLEKDHSSTTRQQSFFSRPTNSNAYTEIRVNDKGNILPADGTKEIPLPIFSVKWGEHGQDKWGHPTGPVVDIMISGINGELLNLRQEDDSYSKRPFALIRDMDKLLAISDEEFLKYSPTERSNLVARFAAVHYSAPDNQSLEGEGVRANNLQ